MNGGLCPLLGVTWRIKTNFDWQCLYNRRRLQVWSASIVKGGMKVNASEWNIHVILMEALVLIKNFCSMQGLHKKNFYKKENEYYGYIQSVLKCKSP